MCVAPLKSNLFVYVCKIFFKELFYVYVCFACMRMYNYVNVYYACRGQHWVLDALETELGMDISHHMGSGNQT